MPRLQDLLEYLTQPGTEHVWLLLDIKVPITPAPSHCSLAKKQLKSR